MDDMMQDVSLLTNCLGKAHVAQQLAMHIANKLGEIYIVVLTKG